MVKELDMNDDKEPAVETPIDTPAAEKSLSKKDQKAADKAAKTAAKEADKAAKLAAKGEKKTKKGGDKDVNDGTDLSTEEKGNLLRQLLGEKYGADSVYNANSESADFIKVYTGIAELDYYTGGISLGRMIELVGASQGGKSTLAVIIADAISAFLEKVKKMNGPSLYLDGERTLSRAAIARLGCNPARIEIKKFMNGEEALESASLANKNNLVSSIVIDSLPTLMPEKGMGDEKNYSGQQMGSRAKLISDNIVQLVAEADVSGTTIIAVNQKRTHFSKFGSFEKGAGGKAIEYFVDTRLDLTGSDKLMDGDECVGRIVKVRLQKSKSRAPEKEFQLRLIFDTGFDKLESLVNLGVKLGILKQAGAYYSFGENKSVQGKENFKRALSENKAFHDELHGLVYAEIERIEEDSKVYDPNKLFTETKQIVENVVDFKTQQQNGNANNNSNGATNGTNGGQAKFDSSILG